jgi:carbon storage regulator
MGKLFFVLEGIRRKSMLVLSRKKNERIVIGDDITIVIVEIRDDKVRLGVDCSKEIPVHRKEVFDAIRREEESLKKVKQNPV